MKTYTHLFFDLDNTLTPSRSPIQPHMLELLQQLPHTLIIVSGSTNQQMRIQVGNLQCYQLGQNGNDALDTTGKSLWAHDLSDSEKKDIEAHTQAVRSLITHPVPDENDLIEDRGSQVSFSIYGHNAPPAEKKACDGDFKKRKALLEACPFESLTLDVQVGGSTCLDYFKRGYHKGSNVKKLIELMQWNPEECVYFGDALFPGGNDSSVVGVIETVAVADEEDTYRRLKAFK